MLWMRTKPFIPIRFRVSNQRLTFPGLLGVVPVKRHTSWMSKADGLHLGPSGQHTKLSGPWGPGGEDNKQNSPPNDSAFVKLSLNG